MEKVKYLFLFLITSLLTFSNNMERIEDITMEISEKLSVNNGVKKSEYLIKYIKPDFIRKDILTPELNRGEVYIYNSGKKITYLPLFDQINEEELKEGEDRILETINYILKGEELKEGKINLENGGVVELKRMKKFSGYTFPENIIVYDGDLEVANLKIKNYRINSKLNKEELLLCD